MRLRYFIIIVILITLPVSLISRINNKPIINLNAPPGNFNLTIDIETISNDEAFNLTWTDSQGADNYSVFYYIHFINEFNNSLISLINQTAVSPCEVKMPYFTIGRHFFVIIAYNRSGYTLSNCISILFTQKLNIFFHPLLFLIVGIGIGIVLLVIWLRGRRK